MLDVGHFYMQVMTNCVNNVHMYANKFVVYFEFVKTIKVLCANIISFYFFLFTSTLLSSSSSKTMFNHFTISIIMYFINVTLRFTPPRPRLLLVPKSNCKFEILLVEMHSLKKDTHEICPIPIEEIIF